MWRILTVLLILMVTGCAVELTFGQSPPNSPPAPGYEIVTCGWALDQEAVDCFEQALEGSRGAEIFMEYKTVEGDPIYLVVRSTESGTVDVYIDASHDAFAGERFEVQTCDGDGFEIEDGLFTASHCGPFRVGW